MAKKASEVKAKSVETNVVEKPVDCSVTMTEVVEIPTEVVETNKKELPVFPNDNVAQKFIISDLLRNFEGRTNNSGITYFGTTGRIAKVSDSKNGMKIEFNSEVSPMDGVVTLTANEASEKHMGSCRWIYTGNDINIMTGLIEECIANYNAKPTKEKPKKEKKEKPVKQEKVIDNTVSEKTEQLDIENEIENSPEL